MRFNWSNNSDACPDPPDWIAEDEYEPDEADYDEHIDRLRRAEIGD